MIEPNEDIDIKLNALADGELSRSESEALLDEIDRDPDLRGDLCDIHRIKDMVKYAYAESSAPTQSKPPMYQRRIGFAAAAMLLLTAGFMGGALLTPKDLISGFDLAQVQANPNKVVLFVGFSDTGKFQRVLDQAEHIMTSYAGEGVEVNVLTSAGGIDLLRKGVSPHVKRIQQLSASYESLKFVACNNTIARLVRDGKPVKLIDNAVVEASAVEFVVNRLQQGWSYVAI